MNCTNFYTISANWWIKAPPDKNINCRRIFESKALRYLIIPDKNQSQLTRGECQFFELFVNVNYRGSVNGQSCLWKQKNSRYPGIKNFERSGQVDPMMEQRDKWEVSLFYNTFYIAVINFSLCYGIEKRVFSDCIIWVNNKMISITRLAAIRQINRCFKTIPNISNGQFWPLYFNVIQIINNFIRVSIHQVDWNMIPHSNTYKQNSYNR